MFPGLCDDDEIRRQLEVGLGLDVIDSVDPVDAEPEGVDLDIDQVHNRRVGVGFKNAEKGRFISAAATKLKEVLKSGRSKHRRFDSSQNSSGPQDSRPQKPTNHVKVVSRQSRTENESSSDSEPSRMDLIQSAVRLRKDKHKKAVIKNNRN
ncbi:uncharacterized protein BBOV_IV001890 [Babesia bovis T2Bo]|uniref:Uncharacterized protein n=1 Tax=Babesia bovis TaxID=5865 RepID=A7AVG0_BABBO|nr:uncharacterized protein BBOV_IV001890 [Babesia bovis T2Bo]EDO05786.1 hypothetical protein BBOV_IV001890 [Babesia bovis T2Bo]|eukprot:XP_001609354.1 hypothetical protein [Babesia bovis T2Bo]